MNLVALARHSPRCTFAGLGAIWITFRMLLIRVPQVGMLLGILHAAVRDPRLFLYKLRLKPPYTMPRKDGGIAKLTSVRVNGTDLSVAIRGQRNARPILYLHGGPGMTELPFFMKMQGPLEDLYLCIHYDQRCSSTSGYHAGKLSVETHVEDCIAMLEWIRDTLSDKKAIVIGGSWGSVLGTIVAMRRPDLISHLVLRGVYIDGAHNEEESNRYVLERMRELGIDKRRFSLDGFDKRAADFIRSLEGKTTADPKFIDNLLVQRQFLSSLGGVEFLENSSAYLPKWSMLKQKTTAIALAPEVSLKAMLSFNRSMKKSLNDLWPEMEKWDATTARLEVPLTVCHGRHDHNTPWCFVDKFMEQVQAPDKLCVWFEKSGHSPDKEETTRFISVILDRIPGPGTDERKSNL